MTQEIDLGGTIYISSKRAAEMTGYTQDYVGQIARSGAVDARKISGLWYVQEASLRAYKEKADAYKPEPPQRGVAAPDLETAVSFDGRDYVSASRAAKLTGYTQDYVGQLAREGTISARLIGNRWFVDREEIVTHKAGKDALLASVQAESVGLAKPESRVSDLKEGEREKSELFYKYNAESADLIPQPAAQKLPGREVAENAQSAAEKTLFVDTDNSALEEVEEEIPIRIVARIPADPQPSPMPAVRYNPAHQTSDMARYSLIFLPIVIGIIGLTGVFMMDFTAIPRTVLGSAVGGGVGSTTLTAVYEHAILENIRGLFVRKLTYRQQN